MLSSSLRIAPLINLMTVIYNGYYFKEELMKFTFKSFCTSRVFKLRPDALVRLDELIVNLCVQGLDIYFLDILLVLHMVGVASIEHLGICVLNCSHCKRPQKKPSRETIIVSLKTK